MIVNSQCANVQLSLFRLVLVHHGTKFFIVDTSGPVFVKVIERALPLFRCHIGADLLELFLGDEAVVVFVDGSEGQLRLGHLAAKFLETHFSVHVAILAAKYFHNVVPGNTVKCSSRKKTPFIIDFRSTAHVLDNSLHPL